jgi:hypothetical protein
MFFDMQEYVMTGGIITFPDFPFGDRPLQPDQIKETVVIQGGSTGGGISITGSVNTPEN